MEKVSIYDKDKNYISSLTQWDQDIIVDAAIDEYDPALSYKVHYFNSMSNLAYVVDSTYDGTYLSSKIPNILLTQSRPIHGYIYVDDVNTTTSRNLFYFYIPVRKRPQPSNIIAPDDQDYIRLENVLQECKQYALAAENAVVGIDQYAVQSQSYAVGGTGKRENEDADNAKYYCEAAAQSATQAAKSEAVAQQSIVASEAAKESQKAAEISATNAATSANNAATSEANAEQSNQSANQAAQSAQQSASDAETYANTAQSYAVGGTGKREGEDSDNAKYYYTQVKDSFASVEATVQQASELSEQALQSAESVIDMVSDAQSYAVGGTGKREGEDTDNAKYYCEQAKAAQAFTTVIVTNLPAVGEINTFYLIENIYGGFDKYWWIVDDTGNGRWDSFASGGFATNEEILNYLNTGEVTNG